MEISKYALDTSCQNFLSKIQENIEHSHAHNPLIE
jgi:hypothetical protein